MTISKKDKVIRQIDYTARDFDTIKERLVDFVKTKYPDTYKDFNASSFGSLMFDLVAYVGDQLSFYTDYIANETNPMTSLEEDNTEDLFEAHGLPRSRNRISTGVVQLYIPVPALSTGNAPDLRYLEAQVKNIELRSESGATFMVRDNISLNDTTIEFVGKETAQIDGSKITYYIIKLDANVISGQVTDFAVNLPSTGRRFQKVEVPSERCTEILRVVDAEGNDYFEVDNLSQNVIYRPFANVSTKTSKVPSILKATPVPRRFITEKRGNKTFATFGYGSEDDLKNSVVADPSKIALNIHGKPYVSDTSFDPSKLVSSGKFGVSPSNTTLTITYRYNESVNVNAAAGTINQVADFELDFKDEPNLDAEKVEYMRQNLQAYNEAPINGDISIPTTEEIRKRGMGVFATQKRAVTLQDYVSSVYAMPSTFGSIKRCTVIRDKDDLRRNINIYLAAESASGKLETPSSQLKENVKSWLNSVRMISDTIDLFDAKILNLGLEFDVVPKNGVSMKSLSIDLRKMLYQELTTVPPDIGEHFYISDVFGMLQNHSDVLTVNNVKVKCLSGAGYSDIFYNIQKNISPGKKFVYIPADFIWEIKNETDIKSRQ